MKVNVIHTGVGGITENDVMLASASRAIIIGFNVRPAGKAGATAKSEGVEIRVYRVIYEAVDDVKKAMAGLLAPEYREKRPRQGGGPAGLQHPEDRHHRRLLRHGREDHPHREGAARARRGSDLGGRRRLAASLPGRRARGRLGLRVRHRPRGLQRPQGRRRHRVLRARADRCQPLSAALRPSPSAGRATRPSERCRWSSERAGWCCPCRATTLSRGSAG
ncbi:MAG: hypothetical protein M5U28_31510 [Sandaracinaceae bacterium]|nr:hypothetical protein [Sandaracinaceae bacterium]